MFEVSCSTFRQVKTELEARVSRIVLKCKHALSYPFTVNNEGSGSLASHFGLLPPLPPSPNSEFLGK